MKNHDNLKIQAIENYEPPKIPTFDEDNSALLKKLPSRWQRNAKVLACIGIMGTITLSSLAFPYAQSPAENAEQSEYIAEYSGYNDFELEVRVHHGGSGFPFYVVQITEQEALDIVRSQLEAIGLNFGATPPNYTFRFFNEWQEIVNLGLDLFDDKHNVAISQISMDSSVHLQYSLRHGTMSDLIERIERGFARQSDIAVGAFYTPSVNRHVWSSNEDDEWYQREITDDEARTAIRADITTQVNEFVGFLRHEGILGEVAKPVGVELNGTSIEFDDTTPMFINNRLWLPIRAIFEELDMQVNWNEGPHGNSSLLTASKENLEITIRFFSSIGDWMDINDSPRWFPNRFAIIQNDRTFVTLQVLQALPDMNVEWNIDTNTIVITTN